MRTPSHLLPYATAACALLALTPTCASLWTPVKPDSPPGEEPAVTSQSAPAVRKTPVAARTRKSPAVRPKDEPKSEAVSYDLTRSKKKYSAEEDKLRQQLFQQFSIDALLSCAKDSALACPEPLIVRLSVDTSGVVQGVTLSGAKESNQVWLDCLKETYRKILFDPAPTPRLVKTRFHIDCGENKG